jgi:hypothetical protein
MSISYDRPPTDDEKKELQKLKKHTPDELESALEAIKPEGALEQKVPIMPTREERAAKLRALEGWNQAESDEKIANARMKLRGEIEGGKGLLDVQTGRSTVILNEEGVAEMQRRLAEREALNAMSGESFTKQRQMAQAEQEQKIIKNETLRQRTQVSFAKQRRIGGIASPPG